MKMIWVNSGELFFCVIDFEIGSCSIFSSSSTQYDESIHFPNGFAVIFLRTFSMFLI